MMMVIKVVMMDRKTPQPHHNKPPLIVNQNIFTLHTVFPGSNHTQPILTGHTGVPERPHHLPKPNGLQRGCLSLYEATVKSDLAVRLL